MKIRNFSVLLISALVGAAGIALKDRVMIDQTILSMHFQGSLSAVFFGAAAIAWLAFFFMDHNWYYPLLIGAVKHGIAIESSLKDRVPLINLTTRIGEESPQKLLNLTLRSKDKSSIFYIAIFTLLLILAVGSSWIPASEQNAKQAIPATQSKSSLPEQRNAPPAVPQPVALPAQAAGTTVILNQELYNGTMPVQNSQTRTIKTTVGRPRQIGEKCISPESMCKKEP